MMEATQIPIEILENMTMEALANTVMNHPLLSTIMLAYDHSELAFDMFLEDFNGVKEWMDIEDAAIQLAKLYADAKVVSAGQYEKHKSEEGSSFIDLNTKEAVLNVPQIFSLLNKEEAKALAAIANGKVDERKTDKKL